jgi:hypothetical protein
MQRLAFLAKFLTRNISDRAASACDDVGDGAGESERAIRRAIMIDDLHLCVIGSDDERVREDGGVGFGDPVENLDRVLNEHVLRHKNHRAGFDVR